MIEEKKLKECRAKWHEGDKLTLIERFYKDKNQADGKGVWCKDCVYKYQTSHRELMNTSRNKWRAKQRTKTIEQEEFRKYLEGVKARAGMMEELIANSGATDIGEFKKLRVNIEKSGWDTTLYPLVAAITYVEKKRDSALIEGLNQEQQIVIQRLASIIEDRMV